MKLTDLQKTLVGIVCTMAVIDINKEQIRELLERAA